MSKFICILLFITLFISCSESYYVQYSVQGTATEANIIYLENGNNIETLETLPWVKEIFIKAGEPIGLSAHNTSAGEVDGRVMFMGKGGWAMFERKVSDSFIMIKGVIYSVL